MADSSPGFEPEQDDQGNWWHYEDCKHNCKKDEQGKKVKCPDPIDSPCARADCRCRLFSRQARRNDKWKHEKASDFDKWFDEQQNMEYECFCVKRLAGQGN